MICGRFVKFLEGVSTCSKVAVRHLVNLVRNDRRTLVGATLTKIAKDCNTARDKLTSQVDRNLKYWSPVEENKWRLPMLSELLQTRSGTKDIPGFEKAEIDLMIEDFCTT